MVVDVADFFIAAAVCVNAFVHVAVEHKQRLFGVVGRERCLPLLVALHIQQGDFVGNVHEFGNLLRCQRPHVVHQDFRFFQQWRLGIDFGCEIPFFIQVFGG